MKLLRNIFAAIGVLAVIYVLSGNGGLNSAIQQITQSFSGTRAQSVPASGTESSVPKGLVRAVVTKESDGDTLHARVDGRDETIRILLIDTPEDQKPGTPVEPYSREAAAYAAQVMPVGSTIRLQLGKAPDQRDRYGRLLAYVYEPSGTLYENDIVRRGLARVAYIVKPNTDHLSELERSQTYAKNKSLKIWSIPGYVTSNGYNSKK
ncbi:MAG: thermonuclease family protein [Sporolactobacillus sp.]